MQVAPHCNDRFMKATTVNAKSRASAKKPALGTLRGKIGILDPDWWKPMTDKEVEHLFGTSLDHRRSEPQKRSQKI
jgi:hypothetical protein